MDSIINGVDTDPVSFPSLRCASQHLLEDHPHQTNPDDYPRDQPRCFAGHTRDHATKSLLQSSTLSTDLHSPLRSSAGNFDLDLFGSYSNYTYARPSSFHGHHPDQSDSAVDPGCIQSISCQFNNDSLCSAPRSLPSAPLERLSGTSYTATLWSTGSSSSYTGPSLSQTRDPSLLQHYCPPPLSEFKNVNYVPGTVSEPSPICYATATIRSPSTCESAEDIESGDRILQQLMRDANLFSTLDENSFQETLSGSDHAFADESLPDEDIFDDFDTSVDDGLGVAGTLESFSLDQELEYPRPGSPFVQLKRLKKEARKRQLTPNSTQSSRKTRAASCIYHKSKLLGTTRSSARIGHTPIWVTIHFPPKIFRAVSELLTSNYSQDSRMRQLELPPPFTPSFFALRRTLFISIEECSKRPEYQVKPSDGDSNHHHTISPIPQPVQVPPTSKKGQVKAKQGEYRGLHTVKAHPSFYDNDAKTDRYFSRLNIYELSRILGLQNYKIKLTRDIEFNILEMFRSYCDFHIGFQTWVRGTTKAQRTKLIDRLATVVRPFYPEFSKFQLEIIVRRASYSMMQSRLRRRRRILQNITHKQC